MPGDLQPLVNNQRIVNEDGTPTQYFIRWAQQRQIDIQNGISAEQAEQLIVDYLADHQLQAGTGISITPDGSLANDPTIALNAVIGNLNDVDVLTTPPTNGQVLIYDDVDMMWKPGDQTGGGGGGGALAVIAQVVVTVAQPTIDFSAIPGNFDDLVVAISGRGTNASNTLDLIMYFNGDTNGSNYGFQNTATASTGNQNFGTDASSFIGRLPGASATATAVGVAQAVIPDYAGSLGKAALVDGGVRYNTTAANFYKTNTYLYWKNQAAITDIRFELNAGSNFEVGTVITLYGRGGSGGGGGGGASAAAVVQSAYARVSGSGTQNVTLPGAPTPGNIVLAIWNGAGGGGSGAPPSGFAIVGFNMNEDPIYTYSGDAKPGGIGTPYQGCWVAMRRVQTGDSATVTFNRGSDVNNLGLIEITNADIIEFKTQALQMLAGDNFLVIAQRPAHPALRLVIVESDGNDVPALTGTGWTLLNNWSGVTNHAAAIWSVDDTTLDLSGAFAGASHNFPVCWQINCAKYSGS